MSEQSAIVYTSTCQHCGKVFERPSGRNLKACYPCRRARWDENVEQQHGKSGEFYEAQVRKSLQYWRSEAKRLGIRG